MSLDVITAVLLIVVPVTFNIAAGARAPSVSVAPGFLS
jgi:hypothetical protein